MNSSRYVESSFGRGFAHGWFRYNSSVRRTTFGSERNSFPRGFPMRRLLDMALFMTSRQLSPLLFGTLLIAVLALLVCLIPKPENDLFFELRIGTDILTSHHIPHFDTYSWSERGRRWDVPEWGAFVLYALAYKAGAYFGTWLLMALLTVATAWVVWLTLYRQAGAAWAFGLTTLMLLAMSDTLQERPYAFSYLLLAVSLKIVTNARDSRLRYLLWLLPLCALWANLHQGVLVLVGLLAVWGLGDACTALGGHSGAGRRAGVMLGLAAACAGASLLTPYGWRLYLNVLITLRDHALMANVTEWNPITVLPLRQLQPFLAVTLCVFGTLALSKQRSLPDLLAAAALWVNALLHARNIALFAVGGLMIASVHLPSAVEQIKRALGLTERSSLRDALLGAFAFLIVAATALVSLASLHRAVGPRGYSPEGIGEAAARVPSFPSKAVAFMNAEQFPPQLRLLNDFETGGYLLWRLPSEPVFVDGRLDVYTGQTFDDMVTLSRAPGTPQWTALVTQYDFDCVFTENKPEADAFAADPHWQRVFAYPYALPNSRRKPHEFLFLRRVPKFAPLIARCLRTEAQTRKQQSGNVAPQNKLQNKNIAVAYAGNSRDAAE